MFRPEDVPTLLRRAGIVGAGGAGFPTYVKFERPTKVLIANGTESEPGYYADKILMRDQPDVIGKALSLLGEIFAYERVVLAVKEKHMAYTHELAHIGQETGAFEMAYVPDQYMMGEEKTLTKFVTGQTVPRGAIPPHVGVTVDNVETLYNVYWALSEHRPVTRKFFQTLGEVPHAQALEAPIGTPVADVWRHAGAATEDLHLIDGGPLLGDVVDADHVVTKTTNGLMLVAPDKLKGRGKHYPGPSHEPPTRLEVMSDEVDAIQIPLRPRYGEPAIPVVHIGDRVAAGQEIAAYRPDALSVSVHASIPGEVTRMTDTHIHIQR